MVGASLNLAAEQVVEHSAYGRLLERRGNRSATCVPQGVYRTADVDAARARRTGGSRSPWPTTTSGRRCAGSIAAGAGRPTPRSPPRSTGAAEDDARRTHRGVVRDPRPPTRSSRALSGAGVPAEPVVPRARARPAASGGRGARLFEPVEHPVTGTADFIGAPFRSRQRPARCTTARTSPLLGEHNRDVLTRILGLTDAEVDELEADGVIGDVVVGGVLH